MATDMFGSSPEELRQALLNQRAAQFGAQTPQQQLGALAYKGGAGLGQALGGLFGVDVTPSEVRRLQQRQEMLKGVDVEDPAALIKAAQEASQAGDYAAAQELSTKARAIQLQKATISKTEAEASKAGREKAAADPFQKLLEKGVYTLKSLAAYKKSGNVEDLDFKTSDAKTQVVDTADGQLLINSSTGAIIANIGKKPSKPSIGSDIAAGLGPVLGAIVKGQAQKSGEAGGTEVGKQSAAIEGKYTALNSVQDALNVVKKGIYAGGYGPLQEGLAKYSGGVLADKQRLVNTEEFRSYIGDVVIPRLAEFGGNDSVEELKYLRSVLAGETTLESKAIQNILEKAQIKIQRGITRIQEQQKAIAGGKQLPTGPTGGGVQQRTTKSGVKYSVEGE